MENAIVLCSGGFDSVITAYYVKKELKPKHTIILFFDYNQRPIKEELYCAQQTSKALNAELKTIKLPWLGEISTSIINKEKEFKPTTDNDLKDIEKQKKEIKKWVVPARNTIFLTSALALAESLYNQTKKIYNIYIGLKDEGKVHFKDTTKEYLKQINNLISHATESGKFKIKAPFINKDKDELTKIAKELNIPLENTYSCYIENGFKDKIPIHCGKCPNCKLRQKAFYWANIKDPSTYKN